jgi:hypothetical protein
VSKNLKILFIALLALAVAAPAMAAKFTFNGDLNNRFMIYTDQRGFFNSTPANAVLDDDDRPDSQGEIKYRMWTTASTNDGAVKGVFAMEVGAVRFGREGTGRSQGGSFSGDGANVETRWFYTDFQIPSIESKGRVRIGLQPHKMNRFYWSETAMGVTFYTDNWKVAWIRGVDSTTGSAEDWHDGDLDTLNARYDLKMEPVKFGFFTSYMWQDTSDPFVTWDPASQDEVKKFPDSNFDLLVLGVDGSWTTTTNSGKLFIKWDALFETGGMDDVGAPGNDLDIQGYLLHADIGVNFGKATVTYTVWYSSGDDNSSDQDVDTFFHVDTDFFESFIFQEGYTDDNVFFEGAYVMDKGMLFNRLALDYAVNKKTKLGIAALYLTTAEDIEWTVGTTTFKEDALGVEIDAYVKYKMYKNLELALNFGYLIADDAMDFFETSLTQDGKSDVDVFLSEARVRFKF